MPRTLSGWHDTAELFLRVADEVIDVDMRPGWASGTSALRRRTRLHPDWSELVTAIERAPGLRFFRRRDGFVCSTGIGFEDMDAEELVDELLLMTWRRLDIAAERYRRQRLRATARAVLADMFRLARGDEVWVPAWLLWDGPDLEPDRTLRGSFGSLRWIRNLAVPYIPGPVYGGLTLFTRLPVTVVATEIQDDRADFYGAGNVTERAFQRTANQVRLALVDDIFDPAPDSPYAPATGPPARLVLSAISAPGSGLGHHTLETLDELAPRGSIINPTALEQRLDFYVRHWHDSADLAARRIAASAEEGRPDDDALVDAVTAWESLLGSPSETTFKVTAAIARLLVKGVDERLRLQRELKQIYELRSRAVHGAADLTISDQAKLDERRRRATVVGSAVLRVMLSERRDLLARKTEQRAPRLLLE